MDQHLRVLGRWRLVDADGDEIALQRKERALLSYLCLERHQHDRAALARLLWPSLEVAKGRNNLRLALHRVRKACGDPEWLLATRGHVEVDADPGLRIDARDLLDGVLDPDDVAPLSLPVLHDAPAWTEWVTAWEETTARSAAAHLEATARRSLATDPGVAEQVARHLLELDPWSEAGHEVLCTALVAQDREEDARQVLRACRAVLHEELGVTPGPRVLDLEKRLDPAGPTAGATSSVDPGEPLSTSPLPVPTTTFVGRTAELATFRELLHDRERRLLSIVAAGGMGKSRLSLEIARADGGRFDEGAAFVRLDGLRDPSDIPGAVAAALGLPSVPASADPARALVQELAEREVLLVLDNLEHLLDGGAQLVADLVATCPHVVVLATSREPLLVSAEDVHELGGLDRPRDNDLETARHSDAVRLFIDRAHRIRKDLRVDATTIDAIRRICDATEGMPLALELAASSLRDMPLADVAAMVEHTPEELRSDLRDVEPRHRAIADVHAQSVARLSAPDRAALLALSCFRGGFTGDAATFVARCDRVTLTRLCRASLLERGHDDRFRMHELHRALSERRLAEDTAAHDGVLHRHAVHHLRRLGAAAPAMSRVGATRVVAGLREDIDNLRAAWSTAVRLRDTSLLVAASAGLVALGRSAGLHVTAASMLADAAEVADDPDEKALLLLRELRVTAVEGSAPRVAELRDAVQSLVADGPPRHRILAGVHLSWSGVAARDLDEVAEAAEHLALAAEAAAHVDDPVLHAYVELERAETAIERVELDEAERLAVAAEGMLASQGHVRGQARANMVLANCLLDQNRLWEAREVLITSIEQGREIGDLAHVANTSSNLGYALLLLGDFEEGEQRTLQAMEAFRRQGLHDSLFHEYAQLGELQLRQGRRDEGEACFRHGIDGMQDRSHDHLLRYQLARWCRYLLLEERGLEAELAAEDLLDHVRRVDAPQFVATAEAMRGHALLLQGRTEDARQAVDLAWACDADLPWPAGTAMDCHHVFAATGDTERAVAARRRAEDVLRSVAARIPEKGARARYLRHSPAATDLAHRPRSVSTPA